MFNFLRRKKNHNLQPVVENNGVSENVIDDVINTDEQIYKDVYSAQELILAEAILILSKPTGYNEERHNRLKEMNHLGFSNAEEVKEFSDLQKMREEQTELKAKIEYYQQTYPLHKFISKEAAKNICEKYQLLLAKTTDYIAEIPEKNQREIISFRIKRKDIRKPSEVVGFSFGSFHEQMAMIGMRREQRESYENQMLIGQDLLIIAPAHKLNTLGKIIEGHILKIKDPIVLQPVDKGYLIVSSWGFEAGDELIVNPINN